MDRIKQLAQAPQQKRIVADVDKRLNILFDLLNNDEVIPPPVISELVKLAQGTYPSPRDPFSTCFGVSDLLALAQRQFDLAQQIHLDVHTSNEQFANWMLGIKRLIDMARAFAQ